MSDGDAPGVPPRPAAAKAGDPGATWDVGTVESLRELQEPGEPDLVRELLDTFRGDSEQVIVALRAQAAAGDAAAAARGAHKLRGGALSLGAQKLAAAATALEKAAKAGEVARLAALAETVASEWDRFVAKAQGA